MFGSLSFNEILFIMVLVLLIFSPKRLPQMGRTIGKALGEFRRASSDLKRSMEIEMTLTEEQQAADRQQTPTKPPVAAVPKQDAEPVSSQDDEPLAERSESALPAESESEEVQPELPISSGD